MKITDAEYELETDPDFITSCKLDGVKVSYVGPKVFGYEGPGAFGGLAEKVLDIVGEVAIKRITEGYYRDDFDINLFNPLNLVRFYGSRVYHGRLYRRDVR